MRYRLGSALVLASLILAACSTGQPAQPTAMPFQTTPMIVTPEPLGSSDASAYPAPTVEIAPAPAYPLPDTVSDPHGRSLSALNSLTIAQNGAIENFDPNVKLYAIVPSQVMLTNLGSPPVLPGWFYKFKVEGSPREFIVQVINGQISGSNKAEVMEPAPPLEQPIDPSQVKIDSDQVYASFAQKAPELGITLTDPQSYDLELVNLEGKGGPIWSVVDPSTLTWLYSISATTGEEVPNPRG